MKKTGVIIDYNGYDGIIETNLKEKYILLREEIVSDEELKKLDQVMFVPENKKYEDYDYNIARFVRKLTPTNSTSSYNHFKQL